MIKGDTGRPCGRGGTVRKGQGLRNTALVSPWFGSVRKGRKEDPCPADSPLKTLRDL